MNDESVKSKRSIDKQLFDIDRGSKCDRCDKRWTEEIGDNLLCDDCYAAWSLECVECHKDGERVKAVVFADYDNGLCEKHARAAGLHLCADCQNEWTSKPDHRYCERCHTAWLMKDLDLSQINDGDYEEDDHEDEFDIFDY